MKKSVAFGLSTGVYPHGFPDREWFGSLCANIEAWGFDDVVCYVEANVAASGARPARAALGRGRQHRNGTAHRNGDRAALAGPVARETGGEHRLPLGRARHPRGRARR